MSAKKLGHDPLLDVAHHASRRGAMASISSRKMMLGACCAASSKSLRRCGFALAVELVDDLRTVDREEVGLGLVRDGAGDERLAAARRAVEQDALGRVDPQPLEDLGVPQRQFDDLADALQLPASARRYPRRTAGAGVRCRGLSVALKPFHLQARVRIRCDGPGGACS